MKSFTLIPLKTFGRKYLHFCSVTCPSILIIPYDYLFSTHNHIKSASELSAGCDYSLFKAGIKPMWEDPRNNNGGRWLISLDKKQRSSELDNYWLEVVSCIYFTVHANFP